MPAMAGATEDGVSERHLRNLRANDGPILSGRQARRFVAVRARRANPLPSGRRSWRNTNQSGAIRDASTRSFYAKRSQNPVSADRLMNRVQSTNVPELPSV